MTIYVVARYWLEDWQIVEAFEAESNAEQFVAAAKRRGDNWHFAIHPVTLSPAAGGTT